ncbi:MAG UNVERIFIED_CONTAM: NTP/NDP exchange transporter [Rickettsiaceae bacterium]|jgi:ADP/ATP carrier protein family
MLSIAQLKDIVWPIKRHELKLFAPMALMMFCILFNFSALRSIKDALVIPTLGAEVISFMKLWIVLPSALVVTLCYAKLSNIFSSEQMFYIVVSSFLSIFIIFAFVLYPSGDRYNLDPDKVQLLVEQYPHFKWFIKLASRWSYALIYVFSELWSVVVINLMFWQFANHIIDSNRAKRFYPFLAMMGNLGLIVAGNSVVYLSSYDNYISLLFLEFFPHKFNDTEITLKLMVILISCVGVIAMYILRYIHIHVFTLKDIELSHNPHNTKTILSIRDSIKLIMNSRYIGYILVIVICYGFVINVLEGPWKAKVRELYPTTQEYLTFMGNFNIWMGTSCVVLAIFTSNLLRHFSWFIAAIMTPSIMAITGTLFFIFVIWGNYFEGISSFDPLYAAVLVGAAQNILSKSTKYSLFDSTKEMAYIPLSVELRTKGKAAAEIVGAKLGKSLGAFVQSFIFILYPMASFDSITPILMIVFLLIILIWFIDLGKLNTEYKKLYDQT